MILGAYPLKRKYPPGNWAKILFSREQRFLFVQCMTTPISILLYVLETALRLLHPIIPFLTETLWQALPDVVKEGPALIVAKWPEADDSLTDKMLDKDFDLIITLIHEIRRMRKEFNVTPGLKIPLIIQTRDKRELIDSFTSEIIALSHIDRQQFKINEKN